MAIQNAEVRQSDGLISCDEALCVAQRDAVTAYRDLSKYRITLLLQEDGWHVDYDLTEEFHAGGGPSYVIDKVSGEIRAKCYYQ